MTSILKPHEDTRPVRKLDWTAFAGAEAGDETRSLVDPEVLELRAETERLKSELADLKAGEPERMDAARAKARQEAEDAFKADEAAKLKQLKAGLEDAIEAARPALANVERLALLLAEHALANAFDDVTSYRDQVANAVRHQAKLIGAAAILKLEVSRADFGDDEALADLANALDHDMMELAAVHSLARGKARIRLMLGDVEIDLPRYWLEIKALLSDLATRPQL